MCHKPQLAVWKKQKHAKAFKTLTSEEAKAVGEKLGLTEPPYKSPECLRCHITGWNLDKEQRAKFLGKRFKVEEGVQCETCHGPGEKYQKLSIMKNRTRAMENGLIHPRKKFCLSCHNEKSPSWDPERFTTKDGKKVGFDYDTCWELIKHPTPEKQ